MAMQITNQADYGLRSMLYIAQNGQNRLTPSNIIAEEMQTRAFSSRINSELVARADQDPPRARHYAGETPGRDFIYDIVT